MAQTKHRSIKTDPHSQFDEEEQKLHIKDYRKKRISDNVEYEYDPEEFASYSDEIEYWLKKTK